MTQNRGFKPRALGEIAIRCADMPVMQWYDRLGQQYHVEEFGWIGWRGIFTQDPEGNTVELVAYDPSLRNHHTV